MRHVANGIQVNEEADAGDRENHDGAQPVDDEAYVDGEPARLNPSVQHRFKSAVIGEHGELVDGEHRQGKRHEHGAARNGAYRATCQTMAEKAIDDGAEERKQGYERNEVLNRWCHACATASWRRTINKLTRLRLFRRVSYSESRRASGAFHFAEPQNVRGEPMAETVFSKILRGDLPCFRVYEDDQVLAFLDVSPLSPGHTLVIPKESAATLDALSDDAAAAIGRVLPKLCRAVMKATGATAYNVLQNNGALAHQAVNHVHFHIIPKTDHDSGLGVGWPATSADPKKTQELARQVAAALG